MDSSNVVAGEFVFVASDYGMNSANFSMPIEKSSKENFEMKTEEIATAGRICGAKNAKRIIFSYPRKIGFCVENAALTGNVLKKAEISNGEVVVLNGNWDTTNTKLPKIIAEMHNVKFEEFPSGWTTTTVNGETCVEQKILDSFNHHQQQQLMTTAASTSEYLSSTSPQGSDSGFEGDCTEGDLSWLLNYKIQELPPVPDSSSSSNTINDQWNLLHHQQQTKSSYEKIQRQYFQQQQQHQNIDVNKIYEEQRQLQCNGEISNANYPQKFGNSAARKPPFTYTELIEHALREKGELTVSGIYQWISDHFPFYKVNDDRWKNSVRHNLSINPHFRKGGKAVHGAGHLWTLAQQQEDRKTWQMKKQRMQQFLKTSMSDWSQEKANEIELANATASILPDQDQEEYSSAEKRPKLEIDICDKNGSSGKVEVEYINCIGVNGYTVDCTDFLIPAVPKEQMAAEFGLTHDVLHADYLITDLNPAALGLQMQMGETEIITGEPLFAEDIPFQTFELHTE